jgi:hypothetical protein
MKFNKNTASRDNSWDAAHRGESAADFDMDDLFQVAERELINPKLSKWDKEDLHGLLMTDLKEFVNATNMQPYCNLTGEDFENEIEKVFPKYLFYDTFNINYTPTEGIKMGNVDESNKWLFDFLVSKASDYYFKTVTESNNFNSYVLTTEIAKQLLVLYHQQNPEGPQDGDGEEGDGNGQSGIQKMLQSMAGSESGQNKLDQAMDQAREKAEQEIEKSEETAENSGGLEAGKDLGSLNFGEINEFMDYTEALKHISLKSDLINNFVKTTLKLSKTYFSSKYKEIEEEMLEADEIDDLLGLENVIPQLKRVHLDDIVTHSRKYHMKFDVYVDISGSMDDRVYQGGTKSNISGLDMAKITCLKLKSLGYVEDVYPFEGWVHEPLKESLAIATMNTCGGTNINTVIQQVRKTGRPSVVITDMQDTITEYDGNVYFIGILGATFRNFRDYSEAGKLYIDNKQCVKYNNDNSFSYVV